MKKLIECSRCLKRLTGDATGWRVLRPHAGDPEYLCANCAELEDDARAHGIEPG